MATGTNIRTYFVGIWHEGDVPVMRAADLGSWLGSTVFDGARVVMARRFTSDPFLGASWIGTSTERECVAHPVRNTALHARPIMTARDNWAENRLDEIKEH